MSKENENNFLENKPIIEVTQIDDKDLAKCVKLMYFCGVNDLGALNEGYITENEYNFIQSILTKLNVKGVK